MSGQQFPDPYKNRVALIGKTGSGKTYAGELLTGHIERLLIVDPKHSESLAGWGGLEPWGGPTGGKRTTKGALRHALGTLARGGMDETERQILLNRRIMDGHSPFRAWFRPPKAFDYERLWEWVFENLHNVAVYVDELYLTLPSKGRGGANLMALYTQARERRIGMWASMQRPSWVPLECLSESEWFYVFRLQLDEDKKRLRSVIGPSAMRELQGHNLLVYRDGDDDARFYPSIEGR